MEGVPLADLMKRGTVTASAPTKVSEPRADMHQNSDELLRQLADFRESKKVTAQAPTVISSVVQEYAPVPPMYVIPFLTPGATPDTLQTHIYRKFTEYTPLKMELIQVLTLLLTPLIHPLRTHRLRKRIPNQALMDPCLLKVSQSGAFLLQSSRRLPYKRFEGKKYSKRYSTGEWFMPRLICVWRRIELEATGMFVRRDKIE
jgi:hypothetical protein